MKAKTAFKPIAVLMIILTVTLALLCSTNMKADAGIYGGEGCGANGGEISWSVDTKTGILTFTGSGDMKDYTEKSAKSPWRSYRAYITTVVIEDGITNVGDYAFYTMYNITEIRLPNSITRIGTYAFADCNALKSVNIPESVLSIGEKAFDKNGIYYNGDAWDNGCVLYVDNALITTKGVMNGSYTAREGTTLVADSAFYNQEEITEITLPDTVIGIGKKAFYGCYALTSVNIPYGVKSIGERTFLECDITHIHIPDTVTEIGEYAFQRCEKLTEIVVPNSVTYIGDGAFTDCISLESLTLPFVGKTETTEIGYERYYPFGYLFMNSTENSEKVFVAKQFIYYITPSDTVSSVGYKIPSSLSNVTITGGAIRRGAFRDCYWFDRVTLEDNVTEIGDEAFYGCTWITHISIGNGVKTIGSEAFYDCHMLKEIEIGSGVEFIGENAFYGCDLLDKINITDLAVWCHMLFETNLSNPLYIGHYLYVNGEILTELIIPDGIGKINAWAFANCYGLQTVDVPDSVTLISEKAFSGCLNLYSVTLGRGVSVIERNSFLDCRYLKTVTFEDPNGWWTEDRTVFGEELSSAEKTAELLGQYADRIWYKGNVPDVPPPPPDYSWVAWVVGLSAIGVIAAVVAVLVLRKKRA